MKKEHPKLSEIPLLKETPKHQRIGIERPHKLISHAGRFYIQKLRAQYELNVVNQNKSNPNQDTSQRTKPAPLKNVIIKPSDDNPLEYPVFIGENGIPIVLFQSNAAVLGQGGFGTVYLGVELDDFSKVHAVKVYHKTEKNEPEIKHEANILSSLGKLIETLDLVSEELWYSVQELAPGEPLNQFINKNTPINRETLYSLMMGILTAVDNLHKKHGILHRDLKLENMMYDGKTLTLIDYGSSTRVKDLNSLVYRETKTNVPQTFLYVAPCLFLPETDNMGLEYTEYSDKTEIYAIGIIFAQLLAGSTTGMDNITYLQQVYAYLNATEKPNILPKIESFMDNHFDKIDTNDTNTQRLVALIKSMIHTDNNARPDIASINQKLQMLWEDYRNNEYIPTQSTQSTQSVSTGELELDFDSIIPLPHEFNVQISMPPLPSIVIDLPSLTFSFPMPKADEGTIAVMDDTIITAFQPDENLNENTVHIDGFPNQLGTLIQELENAIAHYSPKQVSKKARLERSSSLTFSFSESSQDIQQSVNDIEALIKALKDMCDNDSIHINQLLQAGKELVKVVSQQYANTEGFEKSKLYKDLENIEKLITQTIKQTPQYQRGASQGDLGEKDHPKPGKS